jgi:hypothetical protein
MYNNKNLIKILKLIMPGEIRAKTDATSARYELYAKPGSEQKLNS